jgi:hypothetical protein
MQKEELPPTVDLAVPPAGRPVPADLGEGASALATSRWRFTQEPESAGPLPVLVLTLDEDGGLERLGENMIAPEIIGSTLQLDGIRHASGIEGLEYVAGAYGAQNGRGDAFAYEGRVRVFYSGLEVAQARVNLAATLDPDDPAVMHGAIDYSVTIEEIVKQFVPDAADQEGEFRFLGRRVLDEP